MRRKKIKSGSGNSRYVGRSVRWSREKIMQAYDSCPPEVRLALQTIVVSGAPVGVAREVRKHGARRVAEAIARAAEAESRDFVAAEFGPDAVAILCPVQAGPRP